jgi:hypothetical protein
MSIEFYRPEINRPVDADGFEIDSATRELAELAAWFAVQPSQEDSAWLAANPLPALAGGSPGFEPSDQDWDDYARWSYGLFTDEDLMAAGLPCG